MGQVRKNLWIKTADREYLPNYKNKLKWIKTFVSVGDTDESIQGTTNERKINR